MLWYCLPKILAMKVAVGIHFHDFFVYLRTFSDTIVMSQIRVFDQDPLEMKSEMLSQIQAKK